MVDRKYRATFWRPFPVAIYVTSFIEEFFGRLSHILRPRRVVHDISHCCMACYLSTDLQNHQDSKICSVFVLLEWYIYLNVLSACVQMLQCSEWLTNELYFIPCIRGAKKSMVNQIPEYIKFFSIQIKLVIPSQKQRRRNCASTLLYKLWPPYMQWTFHYQGLLPQQARDKNLPTSATVKWNKAHNMYQVQ